MRCGRAQRRTRVSAHEHPWDARPCTALPQSPSLQGEEGGTRTHPPLAVPAEASPTSQEQFSKARNQLVPLHPGWSQSPAARRDTGPKPPCFPFHLPKGWGRCTPGAPSPSSTHTHHSMPDHTHLLSLTKPDPKGSTGCHTKDQLPPPSPGSRQGCRLYLELRTNKQQRYLK